MTTKYEQPGDVITLTAATGGVTKDTLHVGTDFAGVILESATGGALYPVAVEGVFVVPKATGVAMTVMDKVYSTATGNSTSATGATNRVLGYAVAAAATGDTTAKVKLATF